MPRAPFDNTVDVWTGPGDPSPSTFLGTFDCRLVVADSILMSTALDPQIIGWVTLDGILPKGIFVEPFLTLDCTKAYQLAIPSGGPKTYVVGWVEVISHGAQPTYYRCQIFSLPLPPPPANGYSCPTAMPAAINVLYSLMGMIANEERWWNITLPPGSYTFTTTGTTIAAFCIVYYGPCNALVTATSQGGSASSGFTNSTSGDVVYTVKIQNIGVGVEDATWIIT